MGHWFDSQAEKLKWETIKRKGLEDSARFEWQKASNAITTAKIRIKNDKEVEVNGALFDLSLHTKKGIIQYPDITQKRILQEIAQEEKYIPNGTQIKLNEILEFEDTDLKLAFKNIRKDNP